MTIWKTGSFSGSPMVRGDYRAPAQKGGASGTLYQGSAGSQAYIGLQDNRIFADWNALGAQWDWDASQFWQDQGGLRTDGATAVLPNGFAIVNNVNTLVEHLGSSIYRVTKTGGVNGNWDADAVSSIGFTGDFVVRIWAPSFLEYMVGINADPLTDSSFASIDRALILRSNGTGIEPWESGVGAASLGTWALNDYFFCERIGSTIKWYKGTGDTLASASLMHTATALSGTVYFDSSLNNSSATFDVLAYFPDLRGQSVTVAQGSVTAEVSFALTGQSVVAARGSVLAAFSFALAGQSIVAAQGSVVAATSLALSGQALAVARGSAVAAPSLALTGQSVASAGGTIAPAASVAVSGQSIVAAQGSTVASPSVGLSGQAITVSSGSLLATASLALTGNGITAAQGSPTSAFSTALAGQSLTAARGTVAQASGVTLTGVSTLIAQGTISPQMIAALVGGELISAAGLLISINGNVVIADAKTTRRLRESRRRYTDKWGVWR